MPTRLRRSTTSVLLEKMSWPSNVILPLDRAVFVRSFMRLIQRRKVLLPHPLGPMKAVTRCCGMFKEMFRNAWKLPYHELKLCT